jgi:hypothetical protein
MYGLTCALCYRCPSVSQVLQAELQQRINSRYLLTPSVIFFPVLMATDESRKQAKISNTQSDHAPHIRNDSPFTVGVAIREVLPFTTCPYCVKVGEGEEREEEEQRGGAERGEDAQRGNWRKGVGGGEMEWEQRGERR